MDKHRMQKLAGLLKEDADRATRIVIDSLKYEPKWKQMVSVGNTIKKKIDNGQLSTDSPEVKQFELKGEKFMKNVIKTRVDSGDIDDEYAPDPLSLFLDLIDIY